MDTIGVITASERAWSSWDCTGLGQTRHWAARAVQCAHSGQWGRPHHVHCALGGVLCSATYTHQLPEEWNIRCLQNDF